MNAVSRLQRRGMRWAETRLTDALGQKPTFRLKGYDYEIPCLASGEERGTIIEIGGIPTTVDLSIVVRLDHFLRADSGEQGTDEGTADVDLPVPVSGAVIIYRGNEYRIITCTQSCDGAGGSHLVLLCADVDSAQ